MQAHNLVLMPMTTTFIALFGRYAAIVRIIHAVHLMNRSYKT